MLPGTVTSDSDLVAELLAGELGPPPRDQLRRAGARAGAHRGAAHARGRVLVRADGRGPRRRRARSRTASGRCASASSTTAGCWRRRPRRSTSSAPTSSARSSRARWSSSTPAATARCGCSPRSRSTPSSACSSSSTSPGPTPRSTARACTQARVRMGEQLAEQAPVEADLVMGVPESGMPAAEGYARRSGIPYGQGLVKNRYIGRTFIAPNQEMRALGVRMKLNPLRDNIAGKRLDRGRRLDRAGHHQPGARQHAARGRRGRGAPAGLVAALPLALLLRHGHRHPRRAASPPT